MKIKSEGKSGTRSILVCLNCGKELNIGFFNPREHIQISGHTKQHCYSNNDKIMTSKII